LVALVPLRPAAGEALSLPSACANLAFSTEEDFVATKSEPPDGNTIISDGDLLSLVASPEAMQCVLCARNAALVGSTFGVEYDLGLDAVDVIDTDTPLVVFSTELNSPDPSQFRAGDLLATNGAVIPNIALTHPFSIGYDIGLDAVHLIGDPVAIASFLDFAGQQTREYWLEEPGRLDSRLEQDEVDIWFSTEEPFGPADAPTFLDGDLLSARAPAFVIAHNSGILPSAPAGIPSRGVDFGLDGVTTSRSGLDQRDLHFSTEILYAGDAGFTDGDALQHGGVITVAAGDLIGCFGPAADFAGLDALHIAIEETEAGVYLPIVVRGPE
jgi:hypothetical protein